MAMLMQIRSGKVGFAPINSPKFKGKISVYIYGSFVFVFVFGFFFFWQIKVELG